MGIWLMALTIHTAMGAHDWGVLHHRNGELARFNSREVCEMMALEVLTRAREQHLAGKLDAAITNVELTCYQPKYA